MTASRARSGRILLVTNIPTPYRVPLFNELNEQLTRAGFHLTVVFSALGYSRRKWKIDMKECRFDWVELASSGHTLGRGAEHTSFLYKGLGKVIRAHAPDLIIVSGFSAATVRVWLSSLFGSTPFLIWAGSVPFSCRREGRWRALQRRVLARRAAGAIAYGSKAREYFQLLGVPAKNIYTAINTVNTDFFSRETARLRSEGAPEGGRKRLCSISYLSPGKNVGKTLDVVARLARERKDFVLDIVGDGDALPALKQYAAELGISELVQFHGFRQHQELPGYLARSSCFLFQTSCDIWGLVLVEAMAAGVPCVASVHAGAAYDIVQEGVTGFVADFADTERVAGIVNWLLDHPDEAAQIGARARQHIAEHVSLQRSAAGFVEAIVGTLAARPDRVAPAAA